MYTKECLDGSITPPHTLLVCLFYSTTVIWHLKWQAGSCIGLGLQIVKKAAIWEEVLQRQLNHSGPWGSSTELLHPQNKYENIPHFLNIVYFCHLISFWSTLQDMNLLNLHSRRTLFQLSYCSWPPLNPTLFFLCVCVCKSPLCCVWAVKHHSEQRLPVKCDCYFNSGELGCLWFVCLSVCASALKFPLQRKKTFPQRQNSDSQCCQSHSSRSKGSTRMQRGILVLFDSMGQRALWGSSGLLPLWGSFFSSSSYLCLLDKLLRFPFWLLWGLWMKITATQKMSHALHWD